MSESSPTQLVFACIPDVHGEIHRLEKAVAFAADWQPDAALVVGDFGRDVAGVEAALTPLGVPVFSVPGNHDQPTTTLGTSLDRRSERFRGLTLFGIGGSGPALLGFPYEWTDEELEEVEFPPWDLLLSHAPPRNTHLDRLWSGRHVGSRVVRERLRQGSALVCGHIHESAGAQAVNHCLCYNAGSLGAPHGATQVGRLSVTISSGTRRWRVAHHRLGPNGWAKVFSDEVPRDD